MGSTMGFPEPKRTYTALEFMIDRAWDDKWSMNASYTLSYSKGNAEGPVNSDFNFADSRSHGGVRRSVRQLAAKGICRTIAVISSSCAARTA